MDEHRPAVPSTSHDVAGQENCGSDPPPSADRAPLESAVAAGDLLDGSDASSCCGSDDDTQSEDSGVSGQHCHQRRHFREFEFGKEPLPMEMDLPGTVRVLDYPLDSLLSVSSGVQLNKDDDSSGANAAASLIAPTADTSSIFRGAKLFLVGTAHFSEDSQNDVKKLIAATQPDVVMVELCPQRVGMLTMDEQTLLETAKQMDASKVMQMIKEVGVVQGVMNALLLSMSAHITEQLGMAPGGEFRVAAQSAERVPGCTVILGDRPISITLQRALGALSFWQKCRLAYYVLLSRKEKITQEDVERCKQGDLLEQLLAEMAGEFPALSRIFVAERDLFMAHYLRTMLHSATVAKINQFQALQAEGKRWEPVRAVAVVGIGHQTGIVKHWGKPVDFHSLMTIPPPTVFGRAFPYAVRGALLGVAAYVAYKIGYTAYARFYQK